LESIGIPFKFHWESMGIPSKFHWESSGIHRNLIFLPFWQNLNGIPPESAGTHGGG